MGPKWALRLGGGSALGLGGKWGCGKGAVSGLGMVRGSGEATDLKLGARMGLWSG